MVSASVVNVSDILSSLFIPVAEQWARADLTRDGATNLLKDQKVNSFVIYGQGVAVGCAAMAVRMSGSITHYPIARMEGQPPRFRLAVGKTEPWLMSIAALVEHYRTPRPDVPFVLSRNPLVTAPARRPSTLRIRDPAASGKTADDDVPEIAVA